MVVVAVAVSLILPGLGRARRHATRMWPDYMTGADIYSARPESLSDRAGESGGESILPPPRRLARTVNIALRVADVADVGRAISDLVQNDLGEYVSRSEMYDIEGQSSGELTIRVAETRLEEVLRALRVMGDVEMEQTAASDLTDQIIDTRARLRNERRIENELLELLVSRENDDLADILKLREALASVRQRIERYEAHEQSLSSRVTLTTLHVSLRGPNAADKGFFSRTEAGIAEAWDGGIEFLSMTVAWIVLVFVGGIIWWVLLAIGLFIVWRRRRW